MSFYHHYTFEEIPVSYNGRTAIAEGSFHVEFVEARPDPSVGYTGGPEIVDYSDLEVTLTYDDETVEEVTDKAERHELLKQISRKVDDDHIYQTIMESY
jgi:hypothetical protein